MSQDKIEASGTSNPNDTIDNEQFPFKICITNVVKQQSPIEKEYPDHCIPSKFKNPTAAKAKKLQFEVIDPSHYEQQAHMVAFRIKTRERLKAWIHALAILYYDHFGNNQPNYDVHWYDDPVEWVHSQDGKSICIDLTENMKLLYKITLHITTGVLQAQGHSKDLFTTRDFPLLKEMVDLTLSLSLEELNECNSQDINKTEAINSITQQTVPKIVNEDIIDHNDSIVKIDHKHDKVTNDQDTNCLNSEPTASGICNRNPTPVMPVIKQTTLTLTYEDIAQLQSSFVDALEKVTRSQSDFIKKAESSFSSAISDALNPIVTAVDKLQKQINYFQKLNQESDTKENSPHPKAVSQLENKIKDLQTEVQTLQLNKHKSANQYLELESEHKVVKTKLLEFNQKNENTIRILQDENRRLDDKFKSESEEAQKLREEIKKLRQSNDTQFEEIMSLKSQLSSMFNPAQYQPDASQTTENQHNRATSRPKALLIGTSNTQGINEARLLPEVDVTKIIAYTLDETVCVVQDFNSEPDIIILHSLTNDIKSIEPNECIRKLDTVITTAKRKWDKVKFIVSLTTPRLDNKAHRVNCEILDALVKSKYLDNMNVYVSENSNMWHGSVPIGHLLKEQDNIHLNERGCSMLASNIKYALKTMLGLKPQYRARTPIRFKGYRGNGRSSHGSYAARRGRY